jgi:hypothetical protein
MHFIGSGPLLIFFCVPAVFAATTPELPPPEATEVWAPAPPVVSAAPASPPGDAIVLFDGRSLDAWEPVRAGENLWRIEAGALVVVPSAPSCDIQTKAAFGDVQLHLEFRTPAAIEGAGQGRGNSGVFFMGQYELQVLDSWRNDTYANGQAGSIYKQHPPLVNASRPPGEWQTYDAVFIAPRFSTDGKLLHPARMTVFHNGVLVQHAAVLRGPTVYRGEPAYAPHAAKLPLRLQDHGDTVAFRNIWIRELDLAE